MGKHFDILIVFLICLSFTACEDTKINVVPAEETSLDARIFSKFRNSIIAKADEFTSSEKGKFTTRNSQENKLISRLKDDGELSTEEWRLLLLNRLKLERRSLSVQEFSKRYAQGNLTRLEQEGLRRYRLDVEIVYAKFHPWHETELLELVDFFKMKKEANRIIFLKAAKAFDENRALICLFDANGFVYNVKFDDD